MKALWGAKLFAFQPDSIKYALDGCDARPADAAGIPRHVPRPRQAQRNDQLALPAPEISREVAAQRVEQLAEKTSLPKLDPGAGRRRCAGNTSAGKSCSPSRSTWHPRRWERFGRMEHATQGSQHENLRMRRNALPPRDHDQSLRTVVHALPLQSVRKNFPGGSERPARESDGRCWPADDQGLEDGVSQGITCFCCFCNFTRRRPTW